MEQTIFDIYAIEKELNELTAQKDAIEARINELKARIMAETEATGEQKFVGESTTFTYIAESTTNKFDSKGFKADHADLYDQYTKTSVMKAHIRITANKDKLLLD